MNVSTGFCLLESAVEIAIDLQQLSEGSRTRQRWIRGRDKAKCRSWSTGRRLPEYQSSHPHRHPHWLLLPKAKEVGGSQRGAQQQGLSSSQKWLSGLHDDSEGAWLGVCVERQGQRQPGIYWSVVEEQSDRSRAIFSVCLCSPFSSLLPRLSSCLMLSQTLLGTGNTSEQVRSREHMPQSHIQVKTFADGASDVPSWKGCSCSCSCACSGGKVGAM